MYRPLCGLIALIFCCLCVSPQLYAISRPPSFLFYELPKVLPDADVVAEVLLSDIDLSGEWSGRATANVVRVIRTSDARLRPGLKITINNEHNDHLPGSRGFIIAKVGTDIEDQFMLCPYTIRHPYPIEAPHSNDCLPGSAETAKKTKIAADQGDVKAQIAVALMYEEGKNVRRRNNEEALKWFHLAAESGNTEAQYELGKKYQRDWIGAEAVKWFKLAAAQGHAEAMYAIGDIYRQGRIITKNKTESAKWIKLAADHEHSEALRDLARMYERNSDIAGNYEEAMKRYRLDAKNGNARSQFDLGRLYDKYPCQGIDECARNNQEKVKWFRLAAEQGDGEAQYYLGRLYQKAQDVKQDDEEAVKWLLLAKKNIGSSYDIDSVEWNKLAATKDLIDVRSSTRGSELARQALAEMYLEGRITAEDNAEAVIIAQRTIGWNYHSGEKVAKDEKEAMKWFHLAAESGAPEAQYELGNKYKHIKKVDEALKWFKLAAAQGYTMAMIEIGKMYEYGGGGVKNDYMEAAGWYRLALAYGDDSALRHLVSIYQQKPEIAKHDQEAMQWLRLAAEKGNKNAQAAYEIMRKTMLRKDE